MLLSVQHEALSLRWRAGDKLILYIKVSPPSTVIRRKLPMKCFISAFISIEIGEISILSSTGTKLSNYCNTLSSDGQEVIGQICIIFC